MATRKNVKNDSPAPTEFQAACYEIISKVPTGSVTTYGAVAEALARRGFPSGASRAVGNAMNRNPFAPKVPCHRVVCSDGTLGGYAGGARKKISLLEREGVTVKAGRVAEFATRFYSPN